MGVLDELDVRTLLALRHGIRGLAWEVDSTATPEDDVSRLLRR